MSKRDLKRKIEELQQAKYAGREAEAEAQRRTEAIAYLDELAEKRRQRAESGEEPPPSSPEEQFERMDDMAGRLRERAATLEGTEAENALKAAAHIEDIRRRRMDRHQRFGGGG